MSVYLCTLTRPYVPCRSQLAPGKPAGSVRGMALRRSWVSVSVTPSVSPADPQTLSGVVSEQKASTSTSNDRVRVTPWPHTCSLVHWSRAPPAAPPAPWAPHPSGFLRCAPQGPYELLLTQFSHCSCYLFMCLPDTKTSESLSAG